MAQHRGRAKMTVRFAGRGAYAYQRALFTGRYDVGTVCMEARYLGPVLHYMNCNDPELERRLSAAKNAWAMLRAFWYRAVDAPFKRM
eukprot:11157530-Alexandrium_andersonii.AAC.1